MSLALATQGTLFKIGTNASPIVYTAIGEVASFQGLDGQAAEIDVTHLSSVAKEFRMGLQDWGNFSMDVNYLPDDPGQIALKAAKADGVSRPFQITLTDTPATVITFLAFVTSAPVQGGVDAKLDGSFNLRITGNVTFT